jgi:hypothetical protein
VEQIIIYYIRLFPAPLCFVGIINILVCRRIEEVDEYCIVVAKVSN